MGAARVTAVVIISSILFGCSDVDAEAECERWRTSYCTRAEQCGISPGALCVQVVIDALCPGVDVLRDPGEFSSCIAWVETLTCDAIKTLDAKLRTPTSVEPFPPECRDQLVRLPPIVVY